RGRYHLRVFGPEGRMNPARAHIRDCEREIVGELALDIEVPLHYVVARRICFYVRLAEGCRVAAQKLGVATWAYSGATRSCRRRRQLGAGGSRTDFEERSRKRIQNLELI